MLIYPKYSLELFDLKTDKTGGLVIQRNPAIQSQPSLFCVVRWFLSLMLTKIGIRFPILEATPHYSRSFEDF